MAWETNVVRIQGCGVGKLGEGLDRCVNVGYVRTIYFVCACMCAECEHCVVVNIPFSGQLVTCREKWVLDLRANDRKLSVEEVLL